MTEGAELLDRFPEGHAVLAPVRDDDGELADLQVLALNRLGGEFLGVAPDELRDRSLSELSTSLIHETFVAFASQVLDDGVPCSFDVAHFTGETMFHLDVVLFPWGENTLCARFDLRQAPEGLDERAKVIRNLMAVVGIARAMIHREESPEAILATAARAGTQLGFTAAWFGLDDGGEWVVQAAEGLPEGMTPPADCLSCTGHSCLERALVEGFPQQIGGDPEDARCALLQAGHGGALVLPLPGSDDRIGVAYLLAKHPNSDERLVLAAQWIATDTGIALENWYNRRRLQASEDQHRTLVELLGEGLLATDGAGTITFANPHIAGLLDLKRERLIGRALVDFIHEDDAPAVRSCLEDPGQDVTPFPLLTLVDRHGEAFPTEVTMHRVRSASGDAVGMMALVRDRTEELASELERQRAIELNQRILDTAPLGFIAVDHEGRVTMVNEAFGRITRMKSAELSSLLGKEIQQQETTIRDRMLALLDQALGGKAVTWKTAEFVLADGTRAALDIHAVPLRDEDGLVDGVLGIVADQTEQYEAAQALRRSETRYRTLAEAAHDIIFLVGPDLRLLYVNPAGARPFGRDAGKTVGTPIAEWFPPAVVERQGGSIRAVFESGQPLFDESEFPFPDGTRCLNTVLAPIRDADGKVIAVQGISRDVTERQQRERQLQQSEQRFRDLVEYLPAGLCILQDDRLVYVNPALTAILGRSREELLALDPDELGLDWPSTELPELDDLVDSMELPASPLQKARRADGSVINVEVAARGIPYGEGEATVAVITDVTREQALEAQLLRTQKMQSIATLAGGVAHDYNNLLTGIAGYTGILRNRLVREGLPTREAEGIDQLRERGGEMTQKLLAFSRRQMIRPVPLDLNRLIEDFAAVASRLIGERVELITDLDPALPFVLGDPVHLEQVLLNMAVNARDAMPDGGTVTFETHPTPLAEGEEVGSALLVVRDQGVGIPSEELDHIFEPFVTSKDAWEGGGLGLAVVYGIVKQHHGALTANSAPGKGTQFTIRLPGTSLSPPEPAAELPAVPSETPSTETLLVAEDDDALRDLLCQVLESAGYRVIAAEDGDEAVELMRRHGDEIALTVLDMVMPKRGGLDAFKEMRRDHPELRTVLISGYAPELARGDALGPGDPILLTKPFTNDQLLHAIRQTLDD